MKIKKVFSLCLIITILSFLGFCVENIWLAMTKGYINNRNMYLPFLLGYGLAVIAIYLIFGTPLSPRLFKHCLKTDNTFTNNFIYFLIVFVCVAVGECLLGTIIEKTCDIVWWNYSNIPLHITKYTSIPTATFFSLLITIFMRYFFVPLNNLFTKTNSKLLYILVLILMTAMFVDFLHSAIRMYRTHELMKLWRIQLK